MDTETHPTIPSDAPIAGPPPPAPPGPVAAEPPADTTGSTWIADAIVAKVAALAAREVDGVEDLRSGNARRGWTRAAERRKGGASVRVDAGSAVVDVRLVVRDGVAIPQVVDAVRARIIERVEFATGLTVTTVDVGVVDVVPAPAPPVTAGEDPPEQTGADAGVPSAPS